MIQIKIFLLWMLVSASFFKSNEAWAQSSKITGKTLWGVFDGRTPCAALAEMLNENVSADCIKIKWRLTLYKDAVPDKGTYELEGFVYKRGNPRVGKWRLLKGTKSDPEAIVLRLDSGKGTLPLFLQKGDENVLFLLDKEKSLMVGNDDFSYALNRKGFEN